MHKYPYGIIGNCSFLAYVHQNNSIDWLCMPRFDSNPLFSAMIDANQGGKFQIHLENSSPTTNQYYIPNTNVLVTELQSENSRIKITDFAPRYHQFERYYRPQMLIRKIEVVSGSPRIRIECTPKGNYGKEMPLEVLGSNHIRYLNIGGETRLTTNIPLHYILDKKMFLLSNTCYLIFTHGVPLESSIEYTAEDFLQKTINYWRAWVKTMSIPDYNQDAIIRSALTLKLHQFEDTGGIIASGTTSLPEVNKAGRNWDYRYCWMRDSYYTLQAFNNIGHFEESEKYAHYIEDILFRENHRVQPMYTITGESKMEELLLDLPGYLNNTPVRIGNAAYTHIQNDVYGQVLVSLLPLFVDQRFVHNYKSKLPLIYELLHFIERSLTEPDAGIWEFRNSQQLHTYSFLFHWAGANAARKIAEHYQDEVLKDNAHRIIEASAALLERSFDVNQNAYCQAINSRELDASTLQLISLGYLKPNSKRAKDHLRAIENKLIEGKERVFRYLHQDDFGKPENSFLICSYWYVDALAVCGELDKAKEVFQELLKYTNHLGLLSEDIAADGSQWGNFPQTYSHVGLMNAAFRIGRIDDKPTFL